MKARNFEIKNIEKVLQRFKVKTLAGGDGCLVWIGPLAAGGYGQFCWGGKVGMAHRFIYEYQHGPIPEGLQIDHLCYNRRCVSIRHLEAVTPRENVQRSQAYNREKKYREKRTRRMGSLRRQSSVDAEAEGRPEEG